MQKKQYVQSPTIPFNRYLSYTIQSKDLYSQHGIDQVVSKTYEALNETSHSTIGRLKPTSASLVQILASTAPQSLKKYVASDA